MLQGRITEIIRGSTLIGFRPPWLYGRATPFTRRLRNAFRARRLPPPRLADSARTPLRHRLDYPLIL